MKEELKSSLDQALSSFLAGRSGLTGQEKEDFAELVASLSGAMTRGHSCLPLNEEQCRLVKKTQLVSEAGPTPLVMSQRRLYLHRYFNYENRLVQQILSLAQKRHIVRISEASLDALFPPLPEGGIDYQRQAAQLSLSRSLAIIAGGPGTGKTTTVVKILALLLEQEGDSLSIGLAAPTGKAAKRLQESIAASLDYLELKEKKRKHLELEATTLHRMLGVRRFSPSFRHNRENPLPWNVVVVDEASMVDLAMMSKLVDSLNPESRLILLGDSDQLCSVESGSVLADLIRSLPETTVVLQRTYRFDDNIKAFAAAIQSGNAEKGWELLTNKKSANLRVVEQFKPATLVRPYIDFMAAAHRFDGNEQGAVFSLFHRFQILCGVHFGPRGVEGINSLVERELKRCGYFCRSGEWYVGRPVLIGRNDYSLNLYNGDVGICLADPVNGDLLVWFEQPDGSFRGLRPSLLKGCETGWAITIHKSQGSEYAEVVVVLPEQDSPVLSKELLYTGVTRAKKSVIVVGNREVFGLGVGRRIQRYSGLVPMLNSLKNKEK